MDEYDDYFPYREGIRERVDGRKEDLPNRTRNMVINALEDTIFYSYDIYHEELICGLTKHYWNMYLQLPYDEMPFDINLPYHCHGFIINKLKECEWYDFFGSIDCILNYIFSIISELPCKYNEEKLKNSRSWLTHKDIENNENKYLIYNKISFEFEKKCHEILRRDNSQYDIVHGRFVKNISGNERESALEAIGTEKHEYQNYLVAALDMLNSKKTNDELQHDYETCFHKCRVALEKILKEITGSSKENYGILINKTMKINPIPPPYKGFVSNFHSMCSEIGGHGRSDGEKTAKIPLTYYETKTTFFVCCDLCNYFSRKYSIE